jgi:gas vesicle protein
MSDAQQFLEKIDQRLEEMRDVDELPPYSDYTSLIKGRGLQEELTKWSQLLSDETNRYSKLKDELVRIKKWRKENLDSLPSSVSSSISDKLDQFQQRYNALIQSTKRRIRTIDKLIESTRSLQTHSNPN